MHTSPVSIDFHLAIDGAFIKVQSRRFGFRLRWKGSNSRRRGASRSRNDGSIT